MNFLKKALVPVFFIFCSSVTQAQKVVTLDLSNSKEVSAYHLTIESFNEVGTFENGTDSYLLLTLDKALSAFEDPVVSVNSTNESFIPAFTGEINDSIKIYYDHLDSTFSFIVTADLSGRDCNQQYSFSYDFINTAPDVRVQTFYISEHAENDTSLGNIQASDAENNTLAFQKLSGAAFSVLDNGELILSNNNQLDYETNDLIPLRVQVTDGRLTTGQDIWVIVEDENEVPVITQNSFQVQENAGKGSSIGFISAEDPENDKLNFTIISEPNDPEIIYLDAASGQLSIIDSSYFDFEQHDQLIIDVEVSDADLVSNTEVVIQIENINEKPELIPAEFSFIKPTSIGAEIGRVEAVDPENDGLYFQIPDVPEKEYFSIDDVTGIITLIKSPEQEDTLVYNLKVEVSDGDLTGSAVYPIEAAWITAIDNHENQIVVYPNPVDKYLFIQSGNIIIDRAIVSDLAGNIIMSKISPDKLDLKDLQKGIYLLQIITRKGKKTYKFFKR